MKKILIAVILTLSLSVSVVVSADNGKLPRSQIFHEVLGLEDINDIAFGIIVRNDGKCADIEAEDLKNWLYAYWDFYDYQRVVAPFEAYSFDEYYIKLWNKDKTKSYTVYSNSGVMVGGYGVPYESHGEIQKNYIWYLPYIGNARSALYNANTKLFLKYLFEDYEGLRDVTPEDVKDIPTNNVLSVSGCSEWAESEIQNAASANLMVYELSDKYKENITRKEFCDLIYRLIATEFSPDSDSRMGQWSVIEKVIDERQIRGKASSISFSDCEDDKIKFLAVAGIIYGVENNNFDPDGNLTREQAAAILYRTAEFLGNKTMMKPVNKAYYSDESSISDWALSAVKSMHEMKIMQGVSEREFSPEGKYTIEQAIATMLRLYECL